MATCPQDSEIWHLSEGERIELVGRSLNNDLLVTSSSVEVSKNTSQQCICPHCRRSIAIKVRLPDPFLPSRPKRAAPVLTTFDKAYVALMYGCAPAYFVGAFVTGWSLKKHTGLTKQDRILMCTDDVPESFRSVLSSVWTIRPVEYINRASRWFYWDYAKSRFKQVFTKLRILNDFAGEYRKVILLDLTFSKDFI